jgi:pimeloyl-ACP methyl ester carboxylesterase
MPRIPLLLLPGLLCDRALWQSQINDLNDVADCQVADLGRHDTLSAMAASVLATAPPRFALAGLSMGGYLALEILRQAPGRVSRLALLSTSARADTPEQSQRREDLMALARQGRFKGVTPRLLPLLLHPDRLTDQALVDTVMGMAERVGAAAFLRQQSAIVQRPDGRALLPGVRCPSLVLCGRQDALTPLERSLEIADAIPGARLSVLEHCGHLSALEHPTRVSAALRAWLED